MGAIVQVNGYENNWQRNADVVVLADGSVVVTYDSYINEYDDGFSGTVVLAQRFDRTGNRIGDETVIAAGDGTTSSDARTTALSDGGYVVAWEYDDYDDILTTQRRVYVQAFDADGTARGIATRVDQLDADDAVLPEVFATAGGGYKVVFGATGVNDPTYDAQQVYSQQFSASGAKIGGNVLVNINEGE